ncbi:MAG: DNA polymerase IV [Firmicutes bacterium]|nr:DNA polymerase IV [Bacillota bacterium]
MWTRTIAHVDMDCFFAAVEALDNPEYRGKPLVVGGPRHSSRSVVSTCSYEARAYGVRSAMPISQAARLCPHAIFIPGNMSRYVQVSDEIMDVLRQFTPLMQQVSIDEAFLDMTGCEHFYKDPQDIGVRIRRAIKDSSGLTASVGIAENKFLAKLASSRCKPDGLMVVSPEDAYDLLSTLPIGKLWGVGEKGEKALARYGIETVKDLRIWPKEWLVAQYGKWGAQLYDLARGIDDDPVIPDEERKSYGSESTFDEDVTDIRALMHSLAQHTGRVGMRLRRAEKLARTVTIKVKYADFSQITRSKTLAEPFDDDDAIYNTACALLEETDMRMAVRLIGLSVSGLSDFRQLSLFEPGEPGGGIDEVLDDIVERYGAKGVIRGRELED